MQAADGYGASHTSFYTDAVAKESYETLQDILSQKVANTELASVLTTMFDACGTITEALRKELVTISGVRRALHPDQYGCHSHRTCSGLWVL